MSDEVIVALVGAVCTMIAALLPCAVQKGIWADATARPHRVDNPGDTGAAVPEWGTFAAALERVPASIRDEFLPPAERVDRRTLHTTASGDVIDLDTGRSVIADAGLLLVPEDVEVTDLAHGPSVLRVSRTAVDQIRFHRGGTARARSFTLDVGWVRPGQPKPVTHWRPGPHGTVDVRAAVRPQPRPPAAPPQ